MKKSFIAANGQAARKSGQEIGLENELEMLRYIMSQGWIRESELQLLTGMSRYTVGQVGRRLSKMNQISSTRISGNTGYFLQMLPAGAERIGEKCGKKSLFRSAGRMMQWRYRRYIFWPKNSAQTLRLKSALNGVSELAKFQMVALLQADRNIISNRDEPENPGATSASKQKLLPCWQIPARSALLPILIR